MKSEFRQYVTLLTPHVTTTTAGTKAAYNYHIFSLIVNIFHNKDHIKSRQDRRHKVNILQRNEFNEG